MGAFNHFGKQTAVIAIVVALLYCVAFTIQQPSTHAPDRSQWCDGYRFGWAHEYCSQDGNCRRPAPRCPQTVRAVRGSSLAAGVEAGIVDADDALNIAGYRDKPDPADEIHGY